MMCMRCFNQNILIQPIQNKSNTKTSYYEKHHGIGWWLLIGCWWWFVVLCWRAFLAICTCGLSVIIGHWRKTGKSKSKTTYNYRNVCVCQNCGNTWYM